MRISNNIWSSFAIIMLLHILIYSLTDFGPLFFIAIYPMFIIAIPLNFFPNKVLILAFITGVIADFFTNNVAGIHSASLVFMAFLQPTVYRIFSRKDDNDRALRCGVNLLGMKNYLLYSVALLFIHNIAFVYIESMKWNTFINSLDRIVFSTIINAIIILLIEVSLFSQKR